MATVNVHDNSVPADSQESWFAWSEGCGHLAVNLYSSNVSSEHAMSVHDVSMSRHCMFTRYIQKSIKWKGHARACPTTLCRELCKNG